MFYFILEIRSLRFSAKHCGTLIFIAGDSNPKKELKPKLMLPLKYGICSCFLLEIVMFSDINVVCCLQDTRVLLLPWMLSVVTTIVVDLTHSVYLFVLETVGFSICYIYILNSSLE